MHLRSKLVGVCTVMAACCALAACSSQTSGVGFPIGSDPVATSSAGGPFLGSQAVSAKSAAPVVGGTLLATRDGNTIVAADPERDAVFLVNAESHQVTTISLQAGDEPGRVAEGPAGTLYVALRRSGALVAIDVSSASVTLRTPVCASPRGVAYDAASDSVYVACRSGLLLTLAASDLSVKRSLMLDADLRDVIVRERDLVVTRYLSAEVMVVAPDGTVSRRAIPQPSPGCATATVLSRALTLPNGQIALAHQVSSDDTVNVSNGGYGFSSCGGGLVTRVVTSVDVDTPSNQLGSSPAGPDSSAIVPSPMTFLSQFVPAAGPLDVAVDAASGQLALIALDTSLTAGEPGGPRTGPAVGAPASPGTVISGTVGASLWLVPLSALATVGNIIPAALSVAVKGQPVAVAFNAGSYIVQSREPATLEFQDGTSIMLSDESHADTGHLLFHMDSGIGISCSSCHPEGGEDGHVWHFPEGMRRTLPLEGGVLERAPFHWDGTLPDMNALFSEVMVKRMNLRVPVSDQQVAALGSFLEQLPELPAADGLDSAAVQRGAALFVREDVGCVGCHGGAQFTDNQLRDVGTGGMFVTPSLLGVGLRSPIFHDGCAKGVSERFGPCGGAAHGNASVLSAAQQADLIMFLRSL
jgi:YVTN family beta-propeller protein